MLIAVYTPKDMALTLLDASSRKHTRTLRGGALTGASGSFGPGSRLSSSPPDGTNGDRTERERAARGHRRGPFGRFEWTVLLIAAFVALAVLVERRVHPDPLPGFRFVETGVVDLPVIGQQVVATGGRAVGTALEQHGVTVRPSHQARKRFASWRHRILPR